MTEDDLHANAIEPELPGLRGLSPDAATLFTDASWVPWIEAAQQIEPLAEPILFQGAADPLRSAEEAVRRLREEMSRCAMAFQAVPAIREAPPLDAYPGFKVWSVELPLTLFPSRDRGFTVVDVAVQFQQAVAGRLQITSIEPESQRRSLARVQMNGRMDTKVTLGASRAAKIPTPLSGDVAITGDVAAALGITFQAESLTYEIARRCRDAAVLEGTRAVWRLDKPEQPLTMPLDAALLSVQVAADPAAGPVTAYGAAIGSTRAIWLSAELGSLWGHLCNILGGVFLRRQPIECRAEWPDLFRGR